MSGSRLTGLIMVLALIGEFAIGAGANDSGVKAASPKASANTPMTQSGVYGFAGARAGDNDPQGVIGECVWIFDAANRAQVAHGNCAANEPGQFRVALKPGKYVVRGPGGNRTIEVKPGSWVKMVSIIPLPISF